VFALSLTALPACGLLFPENGQLWKITPVKFVACTEKSTSCGRLPTSLDEAEAFIVEVGADKFAAIVGEDNLNISNESSVERFSRFAIDDVVSRGYCERAVVPADRRFILSWEGRGERAITVTCVR
jgi:hypothetical protein